MDLLLLAIFYDFFVVRGQIPSSTTLEPEVDILRKPHLISLIRSAGISATMLGCKGSKDNPRTVPGIAGVVHTLRCLRCLRWTKCSSPTSNQIVHAAVPLGSRTSVYAKLEAVCEIRLTVRLSVTW